MAATLAWVVRLDSAAKVSGGSNAVPAHVASLCCSEGMTSIEARGVFLDATPLVVGVALTDIHTDVHAFNKQVPNIKLSIADEDSPEVTTEAILTYVDARELGNALIALADEADARNDQIERD